MSAAPLTVAQLRTHAVTIAEMVSRILLALPTGEYDQEIHVADDFLQSLGVGGQAADAAMHVLLALNKAMSPSGGVVSDGHGGFVPAKGQSYYDPATGEFTGKKT